MQRLPERYSRARLTAGVRARGVRLRHAEAVRRSPGGPEGGASMVEFAFVVPLLIPLLVVVVQLGMAFNYKNHLTQLAGEGARFAAVDRNPGSGTLQEYIKSQACPSESPNCELAVGGSSSVPNPIQVCIDFPEPGSVRVSTNVTYDWLPIVDFLNDGAPLASATVKGSATMRLEKANPTNYSAGCS